MKKVSILIPCYNSESFVQETLNSCLNQTYSNIEVVFVDDGSTDKSFEIALKNKSSNIKVFRQENLGACAARNYAFRKSSGDYVIYLDADDIISPTFVEEHIARVSCYNDRYISFCKWDRFTKSIDEALFPMRYVYKDYEDSFQLLLDLWERGEMLQTSCYMVPRKLVIESGGWDETILMNQDGEFFSRILMIADKALFVPSGHVYYRTGEYSSVSKANSEKKIASLLYTFIKYKENALTFRNNIQVRKALSYNFTYLIYLYGNYYPKLYQKAQKEIDELGVGYQVRITSPRARLMCKIIGFNNFMRIRKFLLQYNK